MGVLILAWNSALWVLARWGLLCDGEHSSGALRAGRWMSALGALASAVHAAGAAPNGPAYALLLLLVVLPPMCLEFCAWALRIAPGGAAAPRIPRFLVRRVPVAALSGWLADELRASRAAAVRRLDALLAPGGLDLGMLIDAQERRDEGEDPSGERAAAVRAEGAAESS